MSSQWSRSRNFDLSKKRASLIRLGSDAHLSSRGHVMKSAILNYSKYDSDDGTELRYVLHPGEGVSHHVYVEALPPRSRASLDEDVAKGQRIDDLEAGGLAIVVKQEWNVEIEPVTP